MSQQIIIGSPVPSVSIHGTVSITNGQISVSPGTMMEVNDPEILRPFIGRRARFQNPRIQSENSQEGVLHAIKGNLVYLRDAENESLWLLPLKVQILD